MGGCHSPGLTPPPLLSELMTGSGGAPPFDRLRAGYVLGGLGDGG